MHVRELLFESQERFDLSLVSWTRIEVNTTKVIYEALIKLLVSRFNRIE